MNDIPIAHLCPLPHRGNAPAIHPPATICDHHAKQLRDRIGDIRRWWDVLPDLALVSGGASGRGFESKPPVRLDIIALTDPHSADDGDIPPATVILTDIANQIAAIRRLTPVHSATAALGLLQVHWAALTDTHDPQRVYGRLSRVWLHLRHLAGESRHVVATCQENHPDPQLDTECGGPITWTGRQTGVIAVCGSCGDEWTDTLILLYEQQTRLAIERQDSA